MTRFELPLMNESYEANNLEDLKPILFDFMQGEGYTDFTHRKVAVADLTQADKDIVEYFEPEHGYVHFFGCCFILEYDQDIEKEAYDLIYDKVDEIATYLHGKYCTNSGDITPEQHQRIQEAIETLSITISEQVNQNL